MNGRTTNELLPEQRGDSLADLLGRIADAIEALAGRVEIGGEDNARYQLGILVGQIRAYVADVEVDPVDVAIDEALGEIGNGNGWCRVGTSGSAAGPAEVCRLVSERSLHVIGASITAERLRERLRSNEAAGWTLHPVPPGATPIRALYEALRREEAGQRARTVLERHCFATVEEVAATPDDALQDFTNIGVRSVAAIRRAVGTVTGSDLAGVRAETVLDGTEREQVSDGTPAR
ncbi:MAG: hypothetical protein ACYCS4_07970 [Acidimicrobiales bacterium]